MKTYLNGCLANISNMWACRVLNHCIFLLLFTVHERIFPDPLTIFHIFVLLVVIKIALSFVEVFYCITISHKYYIGVRTGLGELSPQFFLEWGNQPNIPTRSTTANFNCAPLPKWGAVQCSFYQRIMLD